MRFYNLMEEPVLRRPVEPKLYSSTVATPKAQAKRSRGVS